MAGPWEKYQSAPAQTGGQVFTMPADPRQAAADARAQAAAERAANADERAAAAAMRQAGPQLPAGYSWGANGQAERIPGLPAEKEGDADSVARLNSLVRQINEVQRLFDAGPGKTQGAVGLNDYWPSDANSSFDQATNSLEDIAIGAFKVPGMGSTSDADAARMAAAVKPNRWSRDAANNQTLNDLRGRVDEWFKARSMATPQWTTPTTTQGITANPGAQQQIATGGFAQERDPAMTAIVDAMIRGGKGADQINAALSAAGIAGTVNPEQVGRAQQWLQTPAGRAYKGSIADEVVKSVPTTALNRAAGSEGGAALANLLDNGSFGAVSALLPNNMDAIRSEYPGASLVGQIGGAVGGTAGLAALGRAATSRIAPRMLAGGKGAEIGRNLLADVGYGTVTGTNQGADPTSAALGSTVGSLGGQAVGSVLGRTISGVTSSPTISRMRAQGIVPSLGQIMRGRAADNGGRSFVAGVEDVIGNTGIVNPLVNASRGRALEQANLAGLNIAAHGKGVVENVGAEGIDQLSGIKTKAYGDALDRVRVPADDPWYQTRMGSVDAKGRAVDAARGKGDFGYVMDNQFGPLMQGPTLTGRNLQDAMRLVQGQERAYRKAATGAMPDPMAGGVADALGNVDSTVTGLIARNAPAALPKLKQANAINRSLSVLDDAANRASGEGGVWTGAQLNQSIKANDKKLGGGGFRSSTRSPLFQLAQDMQAVLPNKVPPTGVNAAPALALFGAGAGGAGYAMDDGGDSAIPGYLKLAGLASLAALPYTKTGQGAVAKALLDRPSVARNLGKLTRRKKGLFGAAAVPLALAAQE